jgi:peptidoglycan/LPS O-acetylase OafA/YrhL
MNADKHNPRSDSTRIASLDGFRALSIVMVLWDHAQLTNHFPKLPFPWINYILDGEMGVRIFFVISGFLITTLLLQEEKKCGYISLPLFYKRRALRILPVYWAYILTVVLYAAITGLVIPFWDYFETLTFTTSWFMRHQWILGHSWSLSIEEIFYLVWPFALTRLGPKKRLWFAFAGILLGPILRALNYQYGWRSVTHTVWVVPDVIMWGCLLALLHNQFSVRLVAIFRRNAWIYHSLIVLVFSGLDWAFNHRVFGLITVPFAISFHSLAICYLLYYYSFISKGLVFKMLNNTWVVALGGISYSLYLWQEIFLFPKIQHFFFWQSFPINVLGAVVAAAASYYLLEKPLLKLRVKLRHPALKSKAAPN